MLPRISCAVADEAPVVASVLGEAAAWVAARSKPLWRAEHVALEAVTGDVAAGIYFIAWVEGEAAGVVRLQLEDPDFWPEAGEGEAVYVHRLAVRRRFAGGGISRALLASAVERARELGRRYVRLDCAADRPALRKVYEGFGFRYHSDRDMGFFVVARYEMEVGAKG